MQQRWLKPTTWSQSHSLAFLFYFIFFCSLNVKKSAETRNLDTTVSLLKEVTTSPTGSPSHPVSVLDNGNTQMTETQLACVG